MRKNLTKVLSPLIIAMLLISVLPAFAWIAPNEPHAARAMWLEESETPGTNYHRVEFETATTSLNYKFNVTVFLNIDFNVGAWQFGMTYDKNFLQATGCWYTGGIPPMFPMSELFERAGCSVYTVAPDYKYYNTTHDYVLFGESWAGPEGKFPNGTHCPAALAFVEFKVIGIPGKGETHTSKIAISSEYQNPPAYGETYVQNSTKAYQQLDYVGDIEYSFEWTSPPSPRLAVTPDDKVFEQYPPPAVNSTFDIQIFIDDLDAAWFLVNASCVLKYNETLIHEMDIVFDGVWDVAAICDNATDNIMSFYVEASASPSGDVPIANITFMVMYQGVYPAVDISPLDIQDDVLYDHQIQIPTLEPHDGTVTIKGLLTLPLAWLELEAASNEVILGPEPSVGEQFKFDVVLKNIHFGWYLVGLDFRVSYCPDLMEVVDVEEGTYLQQFNQPGTPATVFKWFDEWPTWGPQLTAMQLILPDENGTYSEPVAGAEPPENGTIATITFEALKQDVSCDPEAYICNLDIYEITMIDKEGTPVPYDTPVNGTYTMLGSYEVGKVIDVYTQYPAPFGGQGIGMPSDMFWPQKEVILCANVSYNCWPVQQKLVTFTVYDNQDNIWTKLQDVTDENGVACVSFRLPWPCDDPESLLGVWRVVADVDVACDVITDEVTFHHDYLINIVEVTTDEYYYEHCDTVHITVTFTSHTQQTRLVAIRVTIHDDLNVPIASAVLIFYIEDAEYCTPKPYEKQFNLHIDKFAYVGSATIYAVPVMMWEGEWVAAGPEGIGAIYILPS